MANEPNTTAPEAGARTTTAFPPSPDSVLAIDHVRLARGMVSVLWSRIGACRDVELVGCEELCESILFHLEAEMTPGVRTNV